MAADALTMQVLDQFKKFDDDDDGSISREELGMVLKALDPKTWNDARLDVLFRNIDRNGDGLIQYEEFLSWAFKASSDPKMARALNAAVAQGDAARVQALLAVGTSPNVIVDDIGNTPLHEAARCGHLDVVKELVGARALLDIKNDQDYTPFDVARDWSPDAAVVRYLESLTDVVDGLSWKRKPSKGSVARR